MKRCVCSRCVFSRAVSELARLTLNGGRLERMHETREKRLETTRGWGWGRRARENSGRPRARQPSEVGKNPPSPTTADTGERGGEGRAAHRHPECAPLEDGMRKDSRTLRAQPSTTNSLLQVARAQRGHRRTHCSLPILKFGISRLHLGASPAAAATGPPNDDVARISPRERNLRRREALEGVSPSRARAHRACACAWASPDLRRRFLISLRPLMGQPRSALLLNALVATGLVTECHTFWTLVVLRVAPSQSQSRIHDAL